MAQKEEENASKKRAHGAEEPVKKQKKDPNAPKKPMTAFMLFSQDARAKVMKDLPELKFGDVSREVGKRWKDASAEDKVLTSLVSFASCKLSSLFIGIAFARPSMKPSPRRKRPSTRMP